MTLAGFALVLAAAFCHATWNFLVKRLHGGPELIWLFSAWQVAIYAPLAVWIVATSPGLFGPMQVLFLVGTAVLHLGYFLMLQTGYRHGDLSLVYPTARATGPILSTALAVWLLGEVVSAQMLLGAGIIVGGVLMLTGGIRPGAKRAGRSLAFGIGTGLLIGSYTAWDAYAVATLAVPPLLMDYASGIGRAVILAPVARQRWSEVQRFWRDHKRAVLAIAVLNALAYILVLYALTFTPVAYVAPLREVSVLLSILAGSLLLGEGDLRRRLGWGALILAGMMLLVTG
ncbi:DMT family transporter [Thalassococcus sp. CAU 1522]|uniref:DMT family transporter n=1 Tax=Thalassococcus arenae TaxID=2851652 RepID=A0ABS6N4J8_9RHOB|nr:DMT family transporter [Thalassococcus arenae]MBV2358938.1 DMT family transporter [Thalassococcus arenae]